jgi:hypothetical protein
MRIPSVRTQGGPAQAGPPRHDRPARPERGRWRLVVTDLPLLGAGRTADVFALGDDRVLRRYRDGFDVTAEAATMLHVAAHGFPVPHVLQAQGNDLVMERVDGPTMLAALAAGGTRVDHAGRVDVAMSAVIIARAGAKVVERLHVLGGARAILKALLDAVDVDPLPQLDAAVAELTGPTCEMCQDRRRHGR